jgi:hypothetical protein
MANVPHSIFVGWITLWTQVTRDDSAQFAGAGQFQQKQKGEGFKASDV